MGIIVETLKVQAIRVLLAGELVTGSEHWSVLHAIYYQRHDLTEPHTLLFVSRKDPINWTEIDRKGPSLIITDKPKSELKTTFSKITIIRVRNVVEAYWKFINYYRSLFSIPVVTITGTCGKTTTKEMMKHILSGNMTVHASISSKNEPRQSFPYLMGIDQNTDVAVFEHGLGNSGNIRHQCMIYQPTIGIITNIGVHHLDGCKNLEGYIQAKSEIIDGIAEGGTLLLNADDQNIQNISLQSFKGKVIYFGVDKKSKYRASDIRFMNRGMSFKLHLSNHIYRVFVPGLGEHQVYNALAAIAVANELGMDIKEAIERLRTFKNMARHLEFSKGIGGSTIIDDTWTNNPTSVEAALNVLDSIGKGKKVILVLGDIKRLGDFEKKYHREIGSMVAKRSIHTLITIGQRAEDIAKKAIEDGTTAHVHRFQDVTGVFDLLQSELDEQTVVLIKGPMSSRSMIEFAKALKGNE